MHNQSSTGKSTAGADPSNLSVVDADFASLKLRLKKVAREAQEQEHDAEQNAESTL